MVCRQRIVNLKSSTSTESEAANSCLCSGTNISFIGICYKLKVCLAFAQDSLHMLHCPEHGFLFSDPHNNLQDKVLTRNDMDTYHIVTTWTIKMEEMESKNNKSHNWFLFVWLYKMNLYSMLKDMQFSVPILQSFIPYTLIINIIKYQR